MVRSLVARGSSVVPNINGTFGPYTSASNNPTRAPIRFSAIARFTATVVFPTPPFPLATATRYFTPAIGSFGGGNPGPGPRPCGPPGPGLCGPIGPPPDGGITLPFPHSDKRRFAQQLC